MIEPLSRSSRPWSPPPAHPAGRVDGSRGWAGTRCRCSSCIRSLALQLLDVLGASAAGEQRWVAWVLPPVLSAGALAVSVLGWHLLEKHAPWLFGPTRPRPGRHSTGRTAPARPAGPSMPDRLAHGTRDAPLRQVPADELATPAYDLVSTPPPPTDRYPAAPRPVGRPMRPPAQIPRPRRGSEASGPRARRGADPLRTRRPR